MAIDAVFIHALKGELEEALRGAKIDKVQQPERDKLILTVRTAEGNRKLLISAGTGNARVHFTALNVENPSDPPMFCMLMRKHLLGARILEILQPDYERILVFRLSVYDEMGYAAEKQLILELMGKNSNIILTGSDGRIVDCLRRRELDSASLRCLQPGMLYRYPEKQDKIGIMGELPDNWMERLSVPDREPDRILMDTFGGISPLVSRELAWRGAKSADGLAGEILRFRTFLSSGVFLPTMLLSDGVPKEMCFMPVRQYGSLYEESTFESFSKMLDVFYEKKDRSERRRSRSRELAHQVKTVYQRTARKLDAQYRELEKSMEREQIRRQAELLKANLWQIRRGTAWVECEDYYTEGCPKVRIDLDPLRTPQQNVTDRFKTYQKMKSAEAVLTELIRKEESELDYLASVADEIERAETEADLAEIAAELTGQGYLRIQKNRKPVRAKKQEPLRFVSGDGFEILVGRNNSQNDELTTKIARRSDLWLHVQKIHGSHVILRTFGEEVPETTLQEAAALAAYYSQGRDGGKIPVDCTQVRYVKKPSGAAPGKVIYTDYRTIMTQSDESLTDRLKAGNKGERT